MLLALLAGLAEEVRRVASIAKWVASDASLASVEVPTSESSIPARILSESQVGFRDIENRSHKAAELSNLCFESMQSVEQLQDNVKWELTC